MFPPSFVRILHDVSEQLTRIIVPGIIQSIEKLQKKCIIKFTETNMHLICNSDTNEGGIQVWSCVQP